MTSAIITFLNGISALILICISFSLAAIYLFQAIKIKTRIQGAGLILSMAVGFGWMGITITYLSVAFYGYNLPWVKSVISFFSYSTIPIGSLAVINVSWNVAGAPKNKWKVELLFIIYSLIYYIVLYTTFQQAVVCPDVPKGEIYDDWISPTSLLYYLLWGEVALASIISAIGWRKFESVAVGTLKKRGLMLFIASVILGTSILLDTVIFMEWAVNILWIPRIAMIFGIILVYFGFKPSKG
ncbi:MAG: hypothetical protein ACTSR8_05530 [Promethearchaeota archaeon]